ncbi:MAG: Asp23/Gls24 family envelope stress response protein [Firmicutes bacterium]|nr:Asp23/Gls24 family envelope stress response protein [Clostridiales bacterium]MBQ4339815.1 Asp23/Gls24 family envelope stress response protein [Bacillota bacterium]
MSEDNNGIVKVTDEVIAVTAAMAAAKVDGVASLVGGITDNITKNILRMNVTKGVKVSRGDEDVLIIDIFVNVYYGYRIPEVAWEIQEIVKKQVGEMTGEVTKAVNIHVQGVVIKESAAKDEGEES